MFDAARAAVDGWLEMEGDRFVQARTIWEKLKKAPDSFLAHEIASPSGTGVWPQDIAGPLEEAKMGFAGPAVLAEHMDALFLEDEGVAYLRNAVEQGWGEIARDLVHRRTFRNDLFHRGAPSVSGGQMVGQMRGLRLAPWDQELQMGTHPSVYGQLKRGLDDRVIEGLQEICAGGEATFGDCMNAIGAEPMQAFQAVMMAYVAGGLIDLRPEAEIAAAKYGCDRFNAVMLRQLRDTGNAAGLAAPGYGGCIQFQDEAQRDVVAGKAEDAGLVKHLETLGVSLG